MVKGKELEPPWPLRNGVITRVLDPLWVMKTPGELVESASNPRRLGNKLPITGFQDVIHARWPISASETLAEPGIRCPKNTASLSVKPLFGGIKYLEFP